MKTSAHMSKPVDEQRSLSSDTIAFLPQGDHKTTEEAQPAAAELAKFDPPMQVLGIIGSGAMGTGIAQVAAEGGWQVKLYDLQEPARERSRTSLQKLMQRLIEKGKRTEEAVNTFFERIEYVDTLEALAGADLVIEAIVERLDIKKDVFAKLDHILRPEAILASNTSSLSIAAIAAACQHPERVLGIHFFNPAALMKLVEIIPAVQSDPQVVEQARSIIDAWGKTTVLAKDTPGFIVNRVARPFYGEALRIMEEGLARPEDIDWAMTEFGGFRMGPFTLMDYIGHDVNFAVTQTVFAAFYYDRRYMPSFVQQRLVEAGYLGRKKGRGFFQYGEGASMPSPNISEEKARQIMYRIVIMLINEAADAVYLGIASRDDVDLAMTRGVNYPKGLLAWADEIGIEACVESMDALFNTYRDTRYRCSPLLRAMKANGQTFYPQSVEV